VKPLNIGLSGQVRAGARLGPDRRLFGPTSVIWPVLGLLILGLTWELIGRLVLRSELIFAPLSSTLAAFWELMRTGVLAEHFLVSAQELLLGYAAAAAIGIVVGAAFAVVPILSRVFTPIVLGAYATPLIAITPLIIVVAGLGLASKIIIVFLLAVFPIIINTESGLRSVDPDYVETARAFRASRMQILRLVIFPAAMVSIVTGLRLAVGRGIIGVVVGEFFGATHGLGFLIVQYSQSFRTARTLAIVLLLAIIGVGANAMLEAVERRLAPWRRQVEQR
jgi:ABC-type nitrate/sulfonate/bicarbonate transport system permease component